MGESTQMRKEEDPAAGIKGKHEPDYAEGDQMMGSIVSHESLLAAIRAVEGAHTPIMHLDLGSMGVAGPTVSEIYSPPRVVQYAAELGVRPGWAMDMLTKRTRWQAVGLQQKSSPPDGLEGSSKAEARTPGHQSAMHAVQCANELGAKAVAGAQMG